MLPTIARVAVLGHVDAGKSTLIGTLTSGQLDDGNGKTRQHVTHYQHELASGRTSSVSHHITGYTEDGSHVTQQTSASANPKTKDKGWSLVMKQTTRVISFVDLAGHEKYFGTSVSGLTAVFPHYVLILVNSLSGVQKMTKEYISVAHALGIPMCFIVTKIDLCPVNVLKRTKKQLFKYIRKMGMPVHVRTNKEAEHLVEKQYPIILTSLVTGEGISLIHHFLSTFPALDKKTVEAKEESEDEQVQFNIHRSYNVVGTGLVLFGFLAKGTIYVGDQLLLSPMFHSVTVRSIQLCRVTVNSVEHGVNCCLAIRTKHTIQKGALLVTNQVPLNLRFVAEIQILHHHSTIQEGYQAVIHMNGITTPVYIEKIIGDKKDLRTRDKATVIMKFLRYSQLVIVGTKFIFREGETKGRGVVTSIDVI